MYEFVRGPLLWVSFIVFFAGTVYRVTSLVALSLKKDKVVYNHMSAGWALRSIFHWLLPLNHTVIQYPFYSMVMYVFHTCLLVVPVFLLAHNTLLTESWGFSLWGLPEKATDYMTVLMICLCFFLIIRRASILYVRAVTTPIDYVLLIAVMLPFLTGYMAYHQWLAYKTMLIIHILSGELMLAIIPFTKLVHMGLFFLSRAHIGMEFGQRRGTVTW